MSRPISKLTLSLVLVCAGACEGRAPEPVAPDVAVEDAQTRGSDAEPEASDEGSAAAAQPPSERPIVLLTNPAELARLPAGNDFSDVVFATPGASTSELNELLAYRSFLNQLEITGGMADFSFPRWWLNTAKTSFSLVGVVNRIDRRDFGQSACGETRLLYRLGYAEGEGEGEGEGQIQRLPVALNVVFEQPDDGQGCVTVARTWMVGETEDPIEALTREGGPLHPSLLTRDHLLAIETNIRIAEDRDASGRNELRVFSWDREEQRLRSIGLEFQPQWKSTLVRSNVRQWLTPESLELIERGAGQLPMPTQDWADVWANEPRRFDELSVMWRRFDANDEPTPLAAAGLASTRAGVEHRLRGMSCAGCHSVRSVAGFHLPGEGGSEQLRGGASAHLLSELPWRERYVAALAAGETPELTRKLHNDGPPGFGRSCSVEGSPVDSLACDPDFTCVEVSGAEFGVCLAEDYAGPGPCTKASQSCRPPSPWFPGGFERRACESGLPCAPVPVTTDFSACKDEDDIWACAEGRAESTAVDGCESQAGCRDGYACVERDGSGSGVCLPSAALAEFRLLGHRTRLR